MDSSTFNVVSLCSGIGGIELGLRLACGNARTVCYCEREVSCLKVLGRRIAEGHLDDAPVWTDVSTFDGKPWRGVVDCVAGGYPCQPFSSLGRKLGERDERWLWDDVARIVGEIGAEWCFFENVSAHLRMGFERVGNDLRSMGYRVAAGLFTASEVGGGHKRERLFVLAHAFGAGRGWSPSGEVNVLDGPTGEAEGEQSEARRSPPSVDDGRTDVGRLSGEVAVDLVFPPGPCSAKWLDVRRELLPVAEPGVFGVVDGNAYRMDRLRCCGNAVVPLMAGYAFRTLANALED